MSAPASVPARARAREPLGRALAGLLVLASAFALWTLATTVALRVGFPYPLEWMEGTSLEHARRLLRGEPLYAAPDAAFVPYLYPPLSYPPFAAAASALGPSLPAARAVSVLFLAGALALLGRAGARAGGSWRVGLVGAGTFALGFGYTGAFMDLVRVDACFLLLLCAALERVVAGRTGAALALLALSALAKQHGLVLLALVSAACVWESPRRHLRALLASWGGLALACGFLQLGSDGWFARYALELPRQHGLEPKLLLSFPLVDLGVYLPVLVLGAALGVARGALSRPLLALVIGTVVVSALGRAHPGGHDNVRLPAFAALCVVGVAPLCAWALDARAGRLARIGCVLALLGQLGALYQPPSFHAPRSTLSRARFEALDAALRRCARGGSRAALDYGGLGDAALPHTMALWDLRLGDRRGLGRDALRALRARLEAGEGPDALAVGEDLDALAPALAQRYATCAVLAAPYPPTGYVPADRSAGAPRQIVYARTGP